MWFTIAKKEVIAAFKNRTFVFLLLIIWLLIATAIIGGQKSLRLYQQERAQAKDLFQKELAEQERDPHAAAHFGTYLFKPLTGLSLYDPGINNYTGSSYRVEAHNQSEMNYASSQDSDAIIRFGELSVASLFQLLLPLLIIFLCFSSITKEREDGTLKVLFTQGLKRRSLLWGKIIGNYFLIVMIVLPAIILLLVKAVSVPSQVHRVLIFISAYLIYFLLFTSITVCISYLCKSSRNSLLILLCTWMWLCIISPKLLASIAATTYFLPSNDQFMKSVEHDFYNGIKDDGTYSERRARFQNAVLKEYGVDSVSQLPVNLDGLMMQNGEDYNTMVYHLHSKPVKETLVKQKTLIQAGAFFTPYLWISQLSMAVAGTDLYHHQDFHDKAGVYRNSFVRILNMELARNGSEYGTYDYKVSKGFLQNMPEFNYQLPKVATVFSSQVVTISALIFWLIILITAIEICIRRSPF